MIQFENYSFQIASYIHYLGKWHYHPPHCQGPPNLFLAIYSILLVLSLKYLSSQIVSFLTATTCSPHVVMRKIGFYHILINNILITLLKTKSKLISINNSSFTSGVNCRGTQLYIQKSFCFVSILPYLIMSPLTFLMLICMLSSLKSTFLRQWLLFIL